MARNICRSLRTTDRALAKRRLAEELENASKLDVKVGKMTLEELLRLYVERLGQYAPKTIASRQSILKIFKQTWPHGLNISVHSVSTGQLECAISAASFRVGLEVPRDRNVSGGEPQGLESGDAHSFNALVGAVSGAC